jgi:uncharacterized protein YerC
VGLTEVEVRTLRRRWDLTVDLMQSTMYMEIATKSTVRTATDRRTMLAKVTLKS